MKRTLAVAMSLALLVGVALSQDEHHAAGTGDGSPSASYSVAALMQARCSVCHGGENPAAGLRLPGTSLPNSLVGVPSTEQTGAVLVSPGDPDRSYLVDKLVGRAGIEGVRMPAEGPYLDHEEIGEISRWIAALEGASGEPAAAIKRRVTGSFSATRLVNLPTTETVGARDVLFRVSHRFVPAATSGHDPEFFGLNGPAHVMLQLSYGVTENISVALAHSNLYNEYELGVRWRFLSQRAAGDGPPMSAALVVGGSLVTQESDENSVFSNENLKLNAQLPVSRGLGDRVALLLVPSYSTNTNHWSDDSDATVALGVGGRVRVARGLSLSGEWVPVLDGYSAEYDGWAAGIDYEVGGHVFQVFGTNNTGVLTDQYLPGGYPELGSSDFRIGFNIFRTFRR
jgi:mono/diheme cytochrome c family protein